MKILLTGHTGFKGAWLTVMLKILGHEVHGISNEVLPNSMYLTSNVAKYISSSTFIDIRNQSDLTKTVKKIDPEVVVHFAAQSLVINSFEMPLETYQINVMGTLNLLESCRTLENLKATLVITSDKVYKNINKDSGYIEADALGGTDPYSSSKAAADIATQSWRECFGQTPIAIARSGNVIGGGDWSRNRLVPDTVRSILNCDALVIRNPLAVRPWQHVLDCLHGYIKLIDSQVSRGTQSEWNFGPNNQSNKNVNDFLKEFENCWKTEINIINNKSPYKETGRLILDSSKARKHLAWYEKLNFEQTISWTVDWYKKMNSDNETENQVKKFLSL